MFPFLLNDHRFDQDDQFKKYVVKNPLQWFEMDYADRNDKEMIKFIGSSDGYAKNNSGLLENVPGRI